MKGDIQNLPVDTLKMFFEMLSQRIVPRLVRYFDLPEYKKYYPILKEMINDLNSITNSKIPEDVDKNHLLKLYKRLEDAINAIEKKGIDDDLRFIAKEIHTIKIELNNLK